MPNVPYPYEVNWHLVTGNGSLIPICSLLPTLTVLLSTHKCSKNLNLRLLINDMYQILTQNLPLAHILMGICWLYMK